MNRKRRRHSAEYKFKVAMEAAQGEKTLSELAQQFQLHPGQISEWKRQLMDEGASVFQGNRSQKLREQAIQETELYEQIGRLKMELEWLKKKFKPLDQD
ncbi:MAG: transposase [Anaerolineae bacterium]|nr:transposase [Anaerolineae bacterium]